MCPRCHSTEVSRSRSRKLKDALMRWLSMRAYRCRECNKRFYLPVTVDRKLRRERAWRDTVQASLETPVQPAGPIAPAK
jgi:hypothetical protein